MGCLDVFIATKYYVPTLCGTIAWGALFYIGMRISPFENREKSIEFASNIISVPHALMCATIGLAYIIQPADWMLPFLCPFVSSNMLADVLFYCIPNREFGFAVHHLIVILFIVIAYSASDAASDVATIYAAYFAIIEYSTSVLTFAYLSRVFSWHNVYYITGIGKFTIYPGFRLIWIPIYWYLFAIDEDAKNYNDEQCSVFMPFIFVCTGTIFLMSFYWFFFLIVPNANRHLYLMTMSDHQETGGGSDGKQTESKIIMVASQETADL